MNEQICKKLHRSQATNKTANLINRLFHSTNIIFYLFSLPLLQQFAQASDINVEYEYETNQEHHEPSEFDGLHVEQQLQYFYVKTPKIISYDYPMKLSRDFGGPLSDHEPFSAELVMADPLNACEPLKNPGSGIIGSHFYYDRVVLAIRGECSFMEKTLNIQKAGGFAAFIYNNEAKDEWILMAKDETSRANEVNISPYFLYHSDGKNIYEAISDSASQKAIIHLPMNQTRKFIQHPPWRVWTD